MLSNSAVLEDRVQTTTGARRREVRAISRSDCSSLILGVHYARRWPSISYAFGLFIDGVLEGVVTYGTPPSAPLRSGIAGKENASAVLELNRLCLQSNAKNDASHLLGRSLRLLPSGKVIISFADPTQGHNGAVYRAANFTYHGLSAKRTDWKVRGSEGLHGQTIADEFRGCEGRRSDLMRAKYGEDFYLEPRPRKHRYIYVTGSRAERRRLREAIRYPVAKFLGEFKIGALKAASQDG